MIAGPPERAVVVPNVVEDYVARRPFQVVWENALGGLTFRIEDSSRTLYLKWMPTTAGDVLAREAQRLRWASVFTPVPAVVDYGVDAESTWLVTEGIDAENAVSPRWKLDPRSATRALGAGLRTLHDALPLEDCPYEWSLEGRLDAVREPRNLDALERHTWSECFVDMTVPRAMDELASEPSLDLVVCHGDACAPNTLIDARGTWVAHLDLGNLGRGDRWADLAILSWSTVWNYGPGWEHLIYDSYGIEPDDEKIRFYRLLWECEG